jgi:hypothetical protein
VLSWQGRGPDWSADMRLASWCDSDGSRTNSVLVVGCHWLMGLLLGDFAIVCPWHSSTSIVSHVGTRSDCDRLRLRILRMF